MKLHHISMYSWDFYFCMCADDTREVIAAHEEEFGEGSGDYLSENVNITSNGRANMRGDLRVSVITINVDSLHERDSSIEYAQSVIAHEACHVANHLSNRIGYNPVQSGDDEPFSYLVGDLMFEGLCEFKRYVKSKKYKFRSAAGTEA